MTFSNMMNLSRSIFILKFVIFESEREPQLLSLE